MFEVSLKSYEMTLGTPLFFIQNENAEFIAVNLQDHFRK